ncbi:hypothetical protein AGR1B_pAt30287 [Agrobacterium fabacearum S56]|nr:hypothetical protein AGR1B_pAt30287 [Agrobacterium fabacearum S56]
MGSTVKGKNLVALRVFRTVSWLKLSLIDNRLEKKPRVIGKMFSTMLAISKRPICQENSSSPSEVGCRALYVLPEIGHV